MQILRFLMLSSLLLAMSCVDREFVEGRAEIVSITDAPLNDSIEIFGNVYRINSLDNHTYLDNEFEVRMKNSDLASKTDTSGFYSLKTTAGAYSLSCQRAGNYWERLMVEINTGEIPRNRKAQIDFYVGYTIE
ncbi:hypothetical protein [Algoriphagus sp. NG3]|uniref:hypothetical protein n=1 Tax=unclassified Algoriphagus TaxID=2641541 RepID=UPI002A811D25|nr:hypothetical protein [Algoriphagus sp. NG3]WPR77552.1 hypothetical protein SLW71_09350 [Algoriphagus sp. NG3]